MFRARHQGSGTAPPESRHLTIAISPSSGHGTSRRLRSSRGPKRQRLPVEIRGSSRGRFSRRGLRQPGRVAPGDGGGQICSSCSATTRLRPGWRDKGTLFGSVARSDNLSHLTATGWQSVRDYGIRTVIALRTVGYSDDEPDEGLAPKGGQGPACPIEDGRTKTSDGRVSTPIAGAPRCTSKTCWSTGPSGAPLRSSASQKHRLAASSSAVDGVVTARAYWHSFSLGLPAPGRRKSLLTGREMSNASTARPRLRKKARKG